MKEKGLVLVAVRLEESAFLRLQAFADQEGIKPSAAGRILLTAVLEGDSGAMRRSQEELRSAGYREGLRAATHQVREAITTLLKENL